MNSTNMATQSFTDNSESGSQQEFFKNQILNLDEVEALIQETKTILKESKLRINQHKISIPF